MTVINMFNFKTLKYYTDIHHLTLSKIDDDTFLISHRDFDGYYTVHKDKNNNILYGPNTKEDLFKANYDLENLVTLIAVDIAIQLIDKRDFTTRLNKDLNNWS